jgi:penicillin-binding protein 1A
MRRALYRSRNLATVHIGLELGAPNVIAMARRFGLTTPIPAYPSIFLGAAEVYPLELVSAYSAFATLGVRAVPYGIVRVESARGEVLWQATPSRYEVLSPPEAWLMVDVMKDVVRRGTAASVWASGFHVPAGGKTGTTNDGTDAWFVGYTPDLVAGAWVGFDRPQKIKANAQGGVLAAPAWTAFMSEVYQRRPTPPDWPRPSAIVSREIDSSTGMLRNPYCPADLVITEYFIEGTEPLQQCTAHTPFNTFFPFDTLAPRPNSPSPVPAPSPTPSRVPLPHPSGTTTPTPHPSQPPQPGRTSPRG